MEKDLTQLRELYLSEPEIFEFQAGMYLMGKDKAPKRQQIIKFCTGQDVSKTKAGYTYTIQVLKNKFDQPELF